METTVTKPRQYIITKGIKDLDLGYIAIASILSLAKQYPNEDMLVFKPVDKVSTLQNGDGEDISDVNILLPETVWVITDDYGDHFVTTVLLPEEY